MRIVVHGQQAFGKAVLEALLKRGEEVVAVYAAPEKEGAKADRWTEAATAATRVWRSPPVSPSTARSPRVSCARSSPDSSEATGCPRPPSRRRSPRAA